MHMGAQRRVREGGRPGLAWATVGCTCQPPLPALPYEALRPPSRCDKPSAYHHHCRCFSPSLPQHADRGRPALEPRWGANPVESLCDLGPSLLHSRAFGHDMKSLVWLETGRTRYEILGLKSTSPAAARFATMQVTHLQSRHRRPLAKFQIRAQSFEAKSRTYAMRPSQLYLYATHRSAASGMSPFASAGQSMHGARKVRM